MTKDWAVIPLKGLSESKTRLASFLGPKRRLFVEALLHDVIQSAADSKAFSTLIVVSADETIAQEAKKQGVSFLHQTFSGLNRAVDEANRHALREHASSVTTILGDIPLVKPEDFRELMHIADSHQRVVMAPSMKGGTNIMLSSPPRVIEPSYGRWSYSKHLRKAQSLGVDTYSISNSRISFDIDTPEDLKELSRRDPAGKTESSRVLRTLTAQVNTIRAR